MFVYFVQHAEAKSEQEDPSRPLSERGLQDITRVASYVSKLDLKIEKIFHSTKLRAKQTAEILLQNLGPVRGMSEVEGLSPLDNPDVWAERLKGIPEDVIIVGHLPHLGRLVSLLLCGDAERNVVSFKMAGIVCLKKDEAGGWSLHWMLTPEIVVGEKGTVSCDGL